MPCKAHRVTGRQQGTRTQGTGLMLCRDHKDNTLGPLKCLTSYLHQSPGFHTQPTFVLQHCAASHRTLKVRSLSIRQLLHAVITTLENRSCPLHHAYGQSSTRRSSKRASAFVRLLSVWRAACLAQVFCKPMEDRST
eukprot:scaffold95173_cov16-Tisochrysis_lutea.AAC.1